MQQTTTAKDGWAVLVREHRLDLGLNLREYGERYGVIRGTVCNWEHSRTEAPGRVTWDVMEWVIEGLGE